MTLKAPLKLNLNRFWGPLSITSLDVGAIKRLYKNITDRFSIAYTWLQQRATGNGESTRQTERIAWRKSERIQKKQECLEKVSEIEKKRKESCKMLESETETE